MFVLITLRGMSQRSYGEIALALMLFTSWARFYCNIGFLVRVFGDVQTVSGWAESRDGQNLSAIWSHRMLHREQGLGDW